MRFGGSFFAKNWICDCFLQRPLESVDIKRPNTGQEAIHWVFSLPELAVWFKAVLHLPEIITIIAIVMAIMVTSTLCAKVAE